MAERVAAGCKPMMVSRKSAACGGSAASVTGSDAPSVAMKRA
jgi:hypothetical protein